MIQDGARQHVPTPLAFLNRLDHTIDWCRLGGGRGTPAY